MRKEGTAAAAAAAEEAAGVRGRADAVEEADGGAVGRSGGRAETPGAEGRGSSEGMEPPWKSLSVIVVTAFFFDMTAAEVEPAGA